MLPPIFAGNGPPGQNFSIYNINVTDKYRSAQPPDLIHIIRGGFGIPGISMIDMKNMRDRISMAPTTQQASALKEMMDARLRAQGHAPGGNFGCEERIMTVDEAAGNL